MLVTEMQKGTRVSWRSNGTVFSGVVKCTQCQPNGVFVIVECDNGTTQIFRLCELEVIA